MKDETGSKVISTASDLVGSHYLWGTRGEIPNVPEEGYIPVFKGRLPTKLITDPHRLDPKAKLDPSRDLAVFAAASKASGKLCVCAGRWRTMNPVGRWTAPNAPDLTSYLEELRATSVDEWEPYFEVFSPRRPFGPGLKSEIYWGENCQDVRHFDCIGFVNWCIWEATKIPYTFDIPQWTKGAPGGKVYHLPDNRLSLQDGDVIAKANHHIGLVTEDGEIIEAQDSEHGVCMSGSRAFNPKSPGSWTHLIRLPY